MKGYVRHRTFQVCMIFSFVVGVALGYVLFGPVEKAPMPNVLYRTQVKFLPFPPGEMLKSETVIWIDAGWDVVGVTEKRLILKLVGEDPGRPIYNMLKGKRE